MSLPSTSRSEAYHVSSQPFHSLQSANPFSASVSVRFLHLAILAANPRSHTHLSNTSQAPFVFLNLLHSIRLWALQACAATNSPAIQGLLILTDHCPCNNGHVCFPRSLFIARVARDVTLTAANKWVLSGLLPSSQAERNSFGICAQGISNAAAHP